MNVICLMGRLVATPELRHTPQQIPVTSFRIAVDRTYQPKGQERQADFFDLVAWRQTAEFICRYFQKGHRIAVNGSLQTRQYTDKEGHQRTAFEIVIDNAFFCESKSQSGSYGGGQQGGGYQSTPRFESQAPAYNETQPAFSTADSSDFVEIVGDDELPF